MTETLPLDVLDADDLSVRDDLGDIDAMATSMRRYGPLTPLTVRPTGGGRYGVVSGARRLQAARRAGLDQVPVDVVDDDDVQAAVRVAAEASSKGHSPTERADAYQQLSDLGFTYREIADAAGVSKNTVNRYMQLHRLDDEEAAAVNAGEMTVSDAYRRTDSPKGRPKEHGTTESYWRGCRCDQCTQANTEYIREYRQRRRQQGRQQQRSSGSLPAGQPPPDPDSGPPPGRRITVTVPATTWAKLRRVANAWNCTPVEVLDELLDRIDKATA